jgi:hypothetical protein
MGDALAEFLPLTPFGIHVVRIEVATLTGVQDEIGFGYRPAQGFARGTGLIVFEVLSVHHRLISPGGI